MKKHFLFMIALPAAITACNNSGSSDSVQKADSANTAMMDSAHQQQIKEDSTGPVTTTVIDKESAEFMVAAADGGMMEVLLGQLAQQKSTNSRVKGFGEMMVRDHSKGGDEFKKLAQKKAVTLPDSVSRAHKKEIDNLAKKSGVDFDIAYINLMVMDHKEDINEFEKASKKVKDAEVKALADKTLPVLKVHLDSAKAIQQVVRY